MKYVFVLIIVLQFFQSFAQEDKKVWTKAKVIITNDELTRMASLGIAVDDGFIKKGEFIIRDFSAAEMKLLQQNGFQYEILEPDAKKYYQERNKTDKKKEDAASKSTKSLSCQSSSYAVPQYFSLGSMGGFYTLAEINAQLDSVRLRFPTLASQKMPLSSTITTYEGRVPYYIRLSSNPDVLQSKPRLMYVGLTHAREPAGMQQLFYFMYYLLENYNTNKTAKFILDNCEIYVVPCLNVDGYVYNQTTDPTGGGLHRKNANANGTSNPGIDLNRNYGYQWGLDDVGSSPDPSTDVYRGASAFSEAETQMMKAFCEQYQFELGIDYHCYSNVLLFPWGFATDSITPDSVLYNEYSALMTRQNGYIYGTPSQTIGYNGNGGAFDWFYGEQTTKPKTICWSPEAGNANDGFWPQITRIQDICTVNLEANLLMALFSTDYAMVEDRSDVFLPNSGYVYFDIKGLGMQLPANYTVTLIPVGTAIQTAGAPVVVNSLDLLETKTDSVWVNLQSGLTAGSTIQYYYKVQTSLGEYFSDTVSLIYGQPNILLADDCNNLANWTSNTWNVTTTSACLGDYSLTDTPTGNYADYATRIITMTQALDLTGYTFAAASFCAHWEVLAGTDYVEFAASVDNGTTWTALCGKYTKAISVNSGKQGYDGIQTEWVDEFVSLENYVGQSVTLRFKLKAGLSYSANYDGFYFDNFQVMAINASTYSSEVTMSPIVKIWPNPAFDLLNYEVSGVLISDITFSIFSIDGRVVKSGTSENGAIAISELEKGAYFIEITTKEGRQRARFLKE